MDITGNKILNATVEQVWLALHDIEILQKSISGCESMQWDSENEISAKLKVKIGPVKANFKMNLTIKDPMVNSGYTLVCSADSGVMGNASGQAKVTLCEVEQGCELSYVAQVSMRGKIAQIGARMMQPAAKKMTNDFFTAFANNLPTQN